MTQLVEVVGKVGIIDGPGINDIVKSMIDDGHDSDGFHYRTVTFRVSKIDGRLKWLSKEIRVMITGLKKIPHSEEHEYKLEGLVVKGNLDIPVRERAILHLGVYSTQLRVGAGKIYINDGNYDYLRTPEEVCDEIERVHRILLEKLEKDISLLDIAPLAQSVRFLLEKLREMYLSGLFSERLRREILDYLLDYLLVPDADEDDMEFIGKFKLELMNTSKVTSLIREK
jgi:hypothetical protein